MAKPKRAAHPKSSKIHPTDLEEFRSALERGHDEKDLTSAEPDEPEPAEPDAAEELSEPVTTEVKSDRRERAHAIPVTVADDQAEPPLPPRPSKPATPPPTSPKGMGTLDRTQRRSLPWGWIITIATVLTVAAVAGWFVFNRAQRFSGEAVKLEFSGEKAVASGSQITITIRYFNSEPVDLVRSELAIEYPEGFRLTDTSQAPTNEAKNSFSLGTIKNGRAGSLTITGTLVGAVGTERTFNGVLTYRPANFSSDFQTRTDYTVKITSSILSLNLEGPTKLAPNGQGTWTVTYTNTSDRDLDQVQVEAVYPEGMEVTKVDPAAANRSAVWDFEQIKQSESGKISITGKATGEVGDSLELTVRISLRAENGDAQLQDERSLLIILVNSGVKTSVAVNGQAEQPAVEAGDDLQYAIRVANQSDSEVTDLTVKATVSGTAVVSDSLENPQAAKVENLTLTWTKTEVPSLALMKPGSDVVLRLTVGTKSDLTVAADVDVNPQVNLRVEVSSPSFDAASTDGATIESITKIATLLKLTGEARYYEDDLTELGSGPIPPVAGETTSYRIRWTITNTTSDANTLAVSTVLPTHVFWTGRNISRDAGDISFDSTTRTVTWRLNKVPAGTGSRLPKLKAEFEVSITPTSADVGQVMVLTNAATATATDSWSTRAREVTQPSLTTELPSDPKGSGQGTVQSAG